MNEKLFIHSTFRTFFLFGFLGSKTIGVLFLKLVSIIKVWNKILCDICCDFLVSYLIIVHLIFFLNQKINRFDNTKKKKSKESVFSTPSFSWRKTREKRLRKKNVVFLLVTFGKFAGLFVYCLLLLYQKEEVKNCLAIYLSNLSLLLL